VTIAVPEYRERLEEMTAEALEEYYAHSAGHKRTYEIAAIYERHADLSTLDQARALADAGAPAELRRFAAEAYVGNGVKHLSDDIANTEAELTVAYDGEDVPYREVRPRIMNEPDAARRRDLHARRCAATEEHLNPMYEEATELERELTSDLGAATVLELYEGFGYDPRGLDAETSRYVAETDALYREQIDAALRRRMGVALEEAALPDFSRLWRAPEFDAGFATERAVPALRATLAGLGIDLDSQRNVELDIEARPGKRPRAFCAPIRVPDRVVLVILPQGGQDDYRPSFTRPATPSTSPTPTAASRRSSGSWATTPSRRASPSSSSTCSPTRPGSTPSSTSARSTTTCASPPFRSSSSCAATPPSWRTRSTFTPGSRSTRCPTAMPSTCPRPSASPTPAATTSRTSTAASTAPATCGRGRSRPSSATTCGPSSGRTGSGAGRPAISCASCGASASRSARTTSCAS